MHLILKKKMILSSVAILSLALLLMTPILTAQTMMTETMLIRDNLNNWADNPYIEDAHDCSDMAFESEEYWETVRGYDCYIVYGHRYNEDGQLTAHVWNVIEIDGSFYEFESTSLSFKAISNTYIVDDVQQGLYVDGIECERSESCDIWQG